MLIFLIIEEMDIDFLCASFKNKVTFFENEEYLKLKENYYKLQTEFEFDDDFYQTGLERYEKYLYNISWEERIDIEQAIYKYINTSSYFEAFQTMKYIDTEIMKFLGEI
jgi:hypothetical protein